jgi:hypothetical protein
LEVEAFDPAGKRLGSDLEYLAVLGALAEESSLGPDLSALAAAVAAAGPGGRMIPSEALGQGAAEKEEWWVELERAMAPEVIAREVFSPVTPQGPLLILLILALLVDIWLRRG